MAPGLLKLPIIHLLRVTCSCHMLGFSNLHATPTTLVQVRCPWPGERPDDRKRGGWQRTLRFLAAGAGLAAVALLGARYVLRARRPTNETPLERARRELRDLRWRIEVRPGSVL